MAAARNNRRRYRRRGRFGFLYKVLAVIALTVAVVMGATVVSCGSCLLQPANRLRIIMKDSARHNDFFIECPPFSAMNRRFL